MGIEEAMAANVPVVASNRCGMPYLVRNGETGYLVDPADADDIAARLGLLLHDDELRAAHGARARQIACERFHPVAVGASNPRRVPASFQWQWPCAHGLRGTLPTLISHTVCHES